MNRFIFDVDGTLTPSRGKIDPEFAEFFLYFCQQNSVYLVTGSDYDKTVEQLGVDIVNTVSTIFNCSGNEIRVKGDIVKQSNWALPEFTRSWLLGKLKHSQFVLRTGNHIEERTGTVNFSVVGRNATLKERGLYVAFDTETQERKRLVNAFNNTFKDLEARIGGETGIDIYERGKDKSQILEHFTKKDKLYFFGDKMSLDGNDYPLAEAIKKANKGLSIEVKDWKFTFETLQYYQEARIAA
jgi:phosphomannomutase